MKPLIFNLKDFYLHFLGPILFRVADLRKIFSAKKASESSLI